MRRVFIAIALIGAAAGCGPPEGEPRPTPPSPAATTASILDRDWVLVALGDRVNPTGSQGRPVTLRFDAARANAGGFAGCNQYGSAYTLRGDSVRFEPPIATKMACDQGLDVENLWLGALPRMRTYRATDSTLVLVADDGTEAHLRRP
jgi:heat shock protein HslJ